MKRSLPIGLLMFLAGTISFGATPTVSAVTNAASNAVGQSVAEGSLVSIYGLDFSSSLAIADSIPLSRQLLGTRALFNGIAAPMLFVAPDSSTNPSQINAQIPWGVLGGVGGNAIDTGMIEVVVENNGELSEPIMIQAADFSPGIFTVQYGIGQAIASNALTGVLSAPVGSLPGVTPILRGEYLTIWCTGLGSVSPEAETGNNSIDQLRLTTTTPSVLFGDVETEGVAAMSPQFVGVYQLNVQVPEDSPMGDAVPLRIRIGDVISRDDVTVAIQ